QADEDLPRLSQWVERTAEREAQINRLLKGLAALCEVLQGFQCLLESSHRLSIGRACHSLLPSLPEIGCGLVPPLAVLRMVGQQFGGRRRCLGKLGLQDLEDALMVLLPRAAEQ